MPLEVKGASWSETTSHVTLQVPLKGVKTPGVDIVSSEEYIKVSFPPHIYEAFLFGAVDEKVSKVTIENGQATFALHKKEQGLWGQLQSPHAKNKEFQKTKRDEAWTYNKEKIEKQQSEKAEENDRLKKQAVKEQIRLEQEERKKLKELKEYEKNKALADMEQLKIESTEVSLVPNNTEDQKVDTRSTKDGSREIFNTGDEDLKKEENVPAPRAAGTIRVSFTPRVFPTPSRESKAPEEEAWLEKVASMNKMKQTDDAVDMEEMNPIWLKDKGDGFYKQGNFVAAINAYTAAIVLDGSVPSLYSNRSACHLHMKQYRECIQDCTMALELLNPPVPANADSRCRALVRRGTAHFNVEEYVEALRDYESGLKICPNNETVRKDADKIRNIIQGTG